MRDFWQHEPADLVIGGPDHLGFVALYLTLLVLLLTKRDWVRRRRQLVRRLALGTTLVQQTAMYSWHLHRGDGPSGALPMHICRVSTLLGLVWLLSDGQQDWAMQTLFYFGLYAYPSLVVPLDIPRASHAMGWSFAANHIITVLLPVFAAVSQDWAPTKEGMRRAYLGFLVYLAGAEVTNRLTGGNYFYLRDKPVLARLPHTAYLGAAAGVTAGLFGVGYAVARRFLPGGR